LDVDAETQSWGRKGDEKQFSALNLLSIV
jgi:hypothetical protein